MANKENPIIRLIGQPMTCLAKNRQDGCFELLAPAVGLYDFPPAPGTYIAPGSPIGYLTQMRRYYHLLVPDGCHGIVTHLHVTSRKQRVEFGQPLITVSPRAETGVLTEIRIEDKAKVADLELPKGTSVILSPTDGIFYRRPNPQSPPYVEVGSIVTQGTVLALVEVMKCFNPIVYAGEPQLPPKAKVSRILASDGAEVKHGEVLFWVEPTE